MHIFVSIVAAGVTLYLLRNAWERFQQRREQRRIDRVLQSSEGALPLGLIAGCAMAALVVAVIAVVTG